MIAISPIRPPSRTVSRIVLPLSTRSMPCLTMYIACASSPSRNSTSPGFSVRVLALPQAARISSMAISLIMTASDNSRAVSSVEVAGQRSVTRPAQNGASQAAAARGCGSDIDCFLDFADGCEYAGLGQDLRQHGWRAALVVKQVERHP